MKRVIVTGADGFIGSHTVKYLLQNEIEVLALGRKESPVNLSAHPLLTYRKCDVTDVEMLEMSIVANYYDTCINFAWAGSAGPDRRDYNLQMRNATDTVVCMKKMHELGCKRFVCAGSIMEKEAAISVSTQRSKPGLEYIYGMGKMTAHHLCKAVAAHLEIELIWAVITNAYGEGEYSPRFINSTLRKIINHEPLLFTAATQNYDFVHIEDVSRAFYSIAKNGKPFCEYLIGSAHARPLKEFILEMQQALAPESTPVFGDIPFTGVNLPIQTFATEDIERDCGFKAEVSFVEGTRRTLEWLITI